MLSLATNTRQRAVLGPLWIQFQLFWYWRRCLWRMEWTLTCCLSNGAPVRARAAVSSLKCNRQRLDQKAVRALYLHTG